MKNLLGKTLLIALSAWAATGSSWAVPVTFTGNKVFGGDIGALQAYARFEVVGNNLKVTLRNTLALDADRPAQILTGIYFDIEGGPTLSTLSANLLPGSTTPYYSGGLCTGGGGDVGCEWAYLGAPSSLPGVSQRYGISSSGLGIFGPHHRFDTTSDLVKPAEPDGLQFGILPSGWVPAGDNGGVKGTGGLIKDGVVFLLSGLPTFFDPLASISNVRFQYGTALAEPSIYGGDVEGSGDVTAIVPEPSSALLLGAGLVFAAWAHRRRRR